MARRESPVAADPALAQKKRARRRLIGAIVLGIAAVIILPLVLDSEPRQNITDIDISIPSLDEALPPIDAPRSGELVVAPTTPSPTVEEVVPPVPATASGATPAADVQASIESVLPEVVPGELADLPVGAAETEAETPASAQASATFVKQAGKRPAREGLMARSDSEPDGDTGVGSTPGSVVPTPGGTSAPTVAEAAAGTTAVATVAPSGSAAPASATSADRFALQVGAYANAGSARAQLDKVRRTGLPAWAETIETAQGKRTRVRVGPFATRAQADQARATLSLAGMESVVVDAR